MLPHFNEYIEFQQIFFHNLAGKHDQCKKKSSSRYRKNNTHILRIDTAQISIKKRIDTFSVVSKRINVSDTCVHMCKCTTFCTGYLGNLQLRLLLENVKYNFSIGFFGLKEIWNSQCIKSNSNSTRVTQDAQGITQRSVSLSGFKRVCLIHIRSPLWINLQVRGTSDDLLT